MPSRVKTCKIIMKFLAARSVLDKKKSEKICSCHTEKHEDSRVSLDEILKSHYIPWLVQCIMSRRANQFAIKSLTVTTIQNDSCV